MESSTTTYLVAAPFELALQSLRGVLADANLDLAGELDMSHRIRERLLIGAAPCRVLFVAASPAAFEGSFAAPCAAVLTPLHIVVSARGARTEIHLLRALPAQNGALQQPAMEVFLHLRARIARAVERIGMRSTFAA